MGEGQIDFGYDARHIESSSVANASFVLCIEVCTDPLQWFVVVNLSHLVGLIISGIFDIFVTSGERARNGADDKRESDASDSREMHSVRGMCDEEADVVFSKLLIQVEE